MTIPAKQAPWPRVWMWFSYNTGYLDSFSLLLHSLFSSFVAFTWNQLESCFKIIGDLLGVYEADIWGHC